MNASTKTGSTSRCTNARQVHHNYNHHSQPSSSTMKNEPIGHSSFVIGNGAFYRYRNTDAHHHDHMYARHEKLCLMNPLFKTKNIVTMMSAGSEELFRQCYNNTKQQQQRSQSHYASVPLRSASGGQLRSYFTTDEHSGKIILPQGEPASPLPAQSSSQLISSSPVLPSSSSNLMDSNHRYPLFFSRYRFVRQIANGGFSQIILAEDLFTTVNAQYTSNRAMRQYKQVAIKIMNSKHGSIGLHESERIKRLEASNADNSVPISRLYNTFYFGKHFCLVFELLGESLLLRSQRYSPKTMPMDDIRKIAVQLLGALCFLRREGIIHADLKPENILMTRKNNSQSLRVADFGNVIDYRNGEAEAYYTRDSMCQTQSYRAPEVVFKLRFDYAIDMWSLGAILLELYLGRIAFQCSNSSSLIDSMQSLLGPIPHRLFSSGRLYSRYFPTEKNRQSSPSYSQPYSRARAITEMKETLGIEDIQFVSFVQGMLTYDPKQRMTPDQALRHPFLSSLFPFAVAFESILVAQDSEQSDNTSTHDPINSTSTSFSSQSPNNSRVELKREVPTVRRTYEAQKPSHATSHYLPSQSQSYSSQYSIEEDASPPVPPQIFQSPPRTSIQQSHHYPKHNDPSHYTNLSYHDYSPTTRHAKRPRYLLEQSQYHTDPPAPAVKRVRSYDHPVVHSSAVLQQHHPHSYHPQPILREQPALVAHHYPLSSDAHTQHYAMYNNNEEASYSGSDPYLVYEEAPVLVHHQRPSTSGRHLIKTTTTMIQDHHDVVSVPVPTMQHQPNIAQHHPHDYPQAPHTTRMAPQQVRLMRSHHQIYHSHTGL